MIIELSDEFDGFSSEKDWNPYLSALGNLINAQANGHHIFLPSRKTLQNLIRLPIFGQRDNAVLNTIIERHSEYGGLARQLEFTLLALPANAGSAAKSQTNQIITLPLTAFENANLSAQFQLIVENQTNDGYLVRLFCEILAKEHGFSNAPRFLVRHGGGQTIDDVYQYHVQLNCPSFCFVDSDRRYPQDTLGQTAASLETKARQLGHRPGTIGGLANFKILQVHEIENFIPPSIIREIFSDEQHLALSIDRLAIIEAHDRNHNKAADKEILRYLDLKTGLRKISIVGADGDEKRFYLKIWGVVEPGKTEADLNALADEFVINALGQNIVPRLTSWADVPRHRRQVKAAVKSSLFYDEVMDLLATIFAYAAADAQIKL